MRRLHRLAVDLLRGWMLLRARDTTDESAERAAVIIAAHADDETLGCGVSIWHKTERGTPVWVIIASDGAAERTSLIEDNEDLSTLRQQEARAALGVLGVPAEQIQFLGFPDGALPDHREELTSALETALRELPADDVLVPALLDGTLIMLSSP